MRYAIKLKTFYLLSILVCLELVIIAFGYLREQKLFTLDDFQIDAQTHYQLAKDTHELLTRNHIPYTLHFGSLLGAKRHAGLIPWDDDVDLAILKTDQARVEALKSQITQLDYQLLPVYFGFKICTGRQIKLLTEWYKISGTCLDIFVMESVDERLQLANAKARAHWPNSYFYLTEFWPLKLYPFGPIHMLGPNKPEPYLERDFGCHWYLLGRKTHHQDKRLAHPIEEVLSARQRQAARLTQSLQDRVRHDL